MNMLYPVGPVEDTMFRLYERPDIFADLEIGAKIGTVDSLKDAIIVAQGLPDVFVGELLVVSQPNSTNVGVVLNIEDTETKIGLVQGSEKNVSAGDSIWRTHKAVETKTGFGMIGRIVDPLGREVAPGDLTKNSLNNWLSVRTVRIENKAPSIIERDPVRKHLPTGVNSVDSLLPIGKGQRELVVGDLGSGKTTLMITIVLNQLGNNENFWRQVERQMITSKIHTFCPCIYVVVGGRRSEMARLKAVLHRTGAMTYTCMVFTGADELAALQYMAPYAGAAMGEWFRNNGYNCVVIYDDLSIHAQAYRQVSLLLRRPPGREAYPGDIFYLHSRLLERAAQMKRDKGGGSLTALPVVETRAGDISSYIPTNVISITDGQIFLSMKLANSGARPAIDLNLSVSRVGSDAQPLALKYVSRRTKLDYALYRAFEGIDKISGDLDPTIKSFLSRGRKITEFFNQEIYKTTDLWEQVVCLHAIGRGYLDDVTQEYVGQYFRMLFNVETAYTYLRPEQVVVLSHRRKLEAITRDSEIEAFDKEIETWVETYSTIFLDLYERLQQMIKDGTVK